MPYPEDFYTGNTARHSLQLACTNGQSSLAGGAYVTLEHGDVRYYVLGPEDGQKVIVLVHGLQWPCTVWEEVVKDLVQRGYRVLVYDNYGRGYSDGPDVTNDMALYTEQLRQLLAHLNWTDIFLAGYSMGGAIAVAFTEEYPSLVRRLVLVAPAGLIGSVARSSDSIAASKGARTGEMPFIGRIAQHPLLLRILMGAIVAREPVASIIAYQMAHCPSTVRAIGLSLRDFPFHALHATYQAVGHLVHIPAIVFWGTKDEMVPYADAALLPVYMPHAKLVTIDHGTHGIVRSHHDLIMNALDDFLK
ncbi:Alpha/Beta hydrolase protein [Syncephalis pseudoplumigaleata]|uniref:Alpha/Beta hydrolase protein n=1 Tax=Syncephalis pseudoplumigaleata TaxID=1712513 RepID=A0A4P9Z5T0_9FUNG|nr:Alpha/Beta hydrolase protein [Syncephalis pseudoplumigaleata]|eukprot:RKP27885.1 Alpha/Beta hydrolase protein [Syncephalis pseudoplumigaleata]